MNIDRSTVAWTCVILVIVTAAVWALCWVRRRPYRIRQYQQYRAKLEKEHGNANALKIYEDAEHVIRYYASSYAAGGFKDHRELHEVAVASLTRALDEADKKYLAAAERAQGLTAKSTEIERLNVRQTLGDLNEVVVKIRVDLAKLQLRCMTKAEQAEYAGKFVTT